MYVEAGPKVRNQAMNLNRGISICHGRERSYSKFCHIGTGPLIIFEMKFELVPRGMSQ